MRTKELTSTNEETQEREIEVLYLCDEKQCKECHIECFHTNDIRHARNFKQGIDGNYWEKGDPYENKIDSTFVPG